MTFDLGKETVGLLKAVEHDLLPYYQRKVKRQEEKKKAGQFHWVCDNVGRFDVSLYLPLDVMNSRDARVVDVLVMVNGLNETYNIYYPHYDRLGTAFATRGIGAVLHPSPFHLNRTPYLADTRYSNAYLKKFGPRKPDPLGTGRVGRPPHRALLSDNFTIFYCFQQLSNELIALAEFLTEKRSALKEGQATDPADEFFYDRFFDRSRVRVNLLGYSLGGLQVLYALLRRPDLFGSCVLVNSGASLKELRTKPVGISDDEWERIVNNALKASDQIPMEIPSPDRQLLWEVLFSRPFLNTDTARLFAENVDRLLFIAGAADIVAPAEMVTQFVRKEHFSGKGADSFQGLNILQLSGLEHPLTNSLAYDRWFFAIVDVVEKFIRRPRRKEVSYRDVMTTLGQLRFGETPWFEWINANRGVYDADGNLDVDNVASLFAEGDERAFKDAYLNSKRYFENDSELVRTLTRRGGRGRP